MSQVKLMQVQDRLFLQAHGLILGFFRDDRFVKAFHTMTPGILKEIKQYEKEIFGRHRNSVFISFFVFITNLVRR